MKNKLGRYTLTATLLALCMMLSACAGTGPASGTEPYDRSLTVNIAADGERKEISPLVYGQFIEHIETCIYDGIWSEKILDRKFYYEVGDSGLSPWTAAGSVASDEAYTYSGGHSVVISAGGSITQKDISLEEKGYTGYFYCATEAGCTVRITLHSGSSVSSADVTVPANGGAFQKAEYELESANKTISSGEYTLEVTEGEGRFDSLSLMPEDNYMGMRLDTLKKLKELNSPIYRWPGGNFVSGYDWQDGVGDRDRRPSRRNLNYMGLESDFADEDAMIASDIVKLRQLGFYGGIEPNDFGLHEFMAMCEYLGAEALMVVNAGLGTAEGAAALVEYCNGAADTKYGAERAANGRAEPYSIRYWSVGNEMQGDWQLGHIPLGEYTQRHDLFAAAMKEKDDSILIIACGDNASVWSDGMFASCGDSMDFIDEHMYAVQDNTDVFSHLNNMRSNLEYRIGNHRKLQQKYPQYADVRIAFNEYAYENVTNPSRLKDGMGIGVFLNTVLDNADVFEMCCYSSTVNATQGCITTEADGAVMQGAGYVLSLYRRWMQPYNVTSAVRYAADIQLDVSATVSEDGKTVSVAVVNPSEYAVLLDCALFENASKIERHTLTGDYYDSYNTTSREEMYLEDADGLNNAVAPAMSVSVFVVERG